MKQLRVILADDHSLFRGGIRALLKPLLEVEVVAEATTGIEAVELAAAHHPDIVIMDIFMPALNGLDATAQITANNPETRVLMLSMHDTEEYVLGALLNGASGYLQKTANPMELELAIKAVANGERFIGSSVSKYVADGYIARGQETGCSQPRLTPRQREVLQLVVEGHRTKAIAQQLGVSSKTVEMHRAHIMQALDIHDIPGLVRYAIRVGMIPVN